MSQPPSTGSVPFERPVLKQNWGPNYHRSMANIPIPVEKAESLLCPVLTLHNKSVEEMISKDVPEIRAYKLGKKRWSYNQFEIKVQNEIGHAAFDVKEALQSSTPPSLQQLSDSCASYKVRLMNGLSIIVHAFMVFEHALDVVVTEGDTQRTFYQWVCVDRTACKKGCNGPVLRPIQRFGRVGKRSGPEAPKNQAGQLKNYKYMYLSMDEAGTHVGGCRFRMLFSAYDETGSTMLGTTVSIPIKVLANNDVPTGAAHVPINITLRSDWVGWYNVSPGMLQKGLSNVHQLLLRDDEDGDLGALGPFGPRYVPEPEPLDDVYLDDDADDEEEGCHGCGTADKGDRAGTVLFHDLQNFGHSFTDPEHMKTDAEEHARIAREMGIAEPLTLDRVGHQGENVGEARWAEAAEQAALVDASPGASPQMGPKRGLKVPQLSPGNSNYSSHTNNHDAAGYPSPLGPPVGGKREHDALMDAAPRRIATHPSNKRPRVTLQVHAGVPDQHGGLPSAVAQQAGDATGAGHAECTLIELQSQSHVTPWMAAQPISTLPPVALHRSTTATSGGLLVAMDTPSWHAFSPGPGKMNFEGELAHMQLEGTLSTAADQLLGALSELPEHMDPLGEFGSPRDRLNSLFNTPRAGLTPRGFEQIFQAQPAPQHL